MRVFLFAILYLLFICSVSFGQSKRFKAWIDTVQQAENQYIVGESYYDFFQNSEVQEVIDLKNVNHPLLDACVFYSINRYRKKSHRSALAHSQEMYKSASVYSKFNSSYAFDGDSKDRLKVIKYIRYAADKYNYHCSQVEASIYTCKLLDIKSFKRFHYDSKQVKNGDSELGIYHGSSDLKKDTTVVREEVEALTYQSFAESIAKSFLKKESKKLRNKSWSESACSVLLDDRSLYKSKIPTAKVVFILGGQRTALIPEDDL